MKSLRIPSTLALIKEQIRPLDFYRLELPNMKYASSQNWCDGGLCPFHADNKAGSFRVHTGTGAFTCFSCGMKGGDIITFTQIRYELNFVEAVQRISRDWGLE